MGAQVQAGSGGSQRRRGRRRGNRVKPMSEINVTPFVDVMLVLLIIFMVAAPLLTVGAPVDLPDTAADALAAEEEEPLTVHLTASGQVLIQTTEVPFDGLVARLQAIAGERTSGTVYVRADGAVPCERFAQVMAALKAGGFQDVGLVTDPNGPTLTGSDQ